MEPFVPLVFFGYMFRRKPSETTPPRQVGAAVEKQEFLSRNQDRSLPR
jgi:hypothetical protein